MLLNYNNAVKKTSMHCKKAYKLLLNTAGTLFMLRLQNRSSIPLRHLPDHGALN